MMTYAILNDPAGRDTPIKTPTAALPGAGTASMAANADAAKPVSVQ